MRIIEHIEPDTQHNSTSPPNTPLSPKASETNNAGLKSRCAHTQRETERERKSEKAREKERERAKERAREPRAAPPRALPALSPSWARTLPSKSHMYQMFPI